MACQDKASLLRQLINSLPTLWSPINIIIYIVIIIIDFKISKLMLKLLLTLLLPLFYVNLTSSASYTWDTSTNYARFYKINGSRAIQNDREGKTMYPITSLQALPQGNSTITFRINSFGQPGSPTFPVFNLGLIAGYNKQKPQVFNSLGALEYQIICNTTTASICIDARCPSQNLRQLFVPVNKTIQLTIDTTNLMGSFFIPSKSLRYPITLVKEYWNGWKMYLFFGAMNLGAEIQILS